MSEAAEFTITIKYVTAWLLWILVMSVSYKNEKKTLHLVDTFFISITREVHKPSGTEGYRGYRPQDKQEEGKMAFNVHTSGGDLRPSQCSQRRKEGAQGSVLKSSEWTAGARQAQALAARVGPRSAEGGGV